MALTERIKQKFCKCDGPVRHVYLKDNHRRTVRTIGYCKDCGGKMYEI